jgi:hypothetical protein
VTTILLVLLLIVVIYDTLLIRRVGLNLLKMPQIVQQSSALTQQDIERVGTRTTNQIKDALILYSTENQEEKEATKTPATTTPSRRPRRAGTPKKQD